MQGEYVYEDRIKYALNGRGGLASPGAAMFLDRIVLMVLSSSSSSGCNSGCYDRQSSMQPKVL